MAKRLPRYPTVPVARLRRLAVDSAYRGRELGGALLWDAGMRALRSGLAAFALVVDAKDEQAEAFYRHHGFILFGGPDRRLVLPLATFAKTRRRAASIRPARCLRSRSGP
jgi:GNAT superfamily N-acetyltransferase